MKMQLKTLAAAALLAFAFGNASAQTAATGTLDKIKANGKVVLGVREASPPMAYMLGAGEKYVGYHVELCERVLKDIAPNARLEYMAVTAQNTIPLVQNGTLDIGCGPTTNNTARQQQVAFALTTYVSEVRMATKVDSASPRSTSSRAATCRHRRAPPPCSCCASGSARRTSRTTRCSARTTPGASS